MKRFTAQEIRSFVSQVLVDEVGLAKKDTSYPRISIVIPSFNQGQFLERTILSVLNQKYPNAEILIIDGGSKDESLEIIQKYEQFVDYWVSEKDDGHADALNKGFRHATGDIFAFLNSDDLYLPGALFSVASEFQNRTVDVVYGNLYYIDPQDAILEERRLTRFSRMGYLYGGCDLLQPTMFWRKDLFHSVGEISTQYKFSFDMELFYRFAEAGARFRFLRGFLGCFRIHPQSKTCTISQVRERDDKKIRASLSHSFDSRWAQRVRFLEKLRRIMIYVGQGDAGWLLQQAQGRASKHFSQRSR
jgi:glycosyltransferase involved in cell wall biosynthesis